MTDKPDAKPPARKGVPPAAAATVEHLDHLRWLLAQFVTIAPAGQSPTQVPTVVQYEHATISENVEAVVVDNRGPASGAKPGPSRKGDTAGQLREVTLACAAALRTVSEQAITLAEERAARLELEQRVNRLRLVGTLAGFTLAAAVPGCAILGALLGWLLAPR